MERLTVRDEYGNADIIGVLSSDIQLNLNYKDFNRVTDALNKLADYEDAEEQGLLLRLPCKVGDWLYYVIFDFNAIVPVRLNDVIMSFIGIDRYSCQYNCCCFDECGDVYEDFEFDTDDIGKTVFLTKEEAEQALAEMKGE